MVVIELDKKDLMNLIGKQIPDEELQEILFLLKVETVMSDEVIECELDPDRPDMFSIEGVARAVKGYLGIETGLPKYNIKKTVVKLENKDVVSRPYIACAIIKNVELTDELIKSLIQIQEKLHLTLGRKRKKVAIGVHDYDKVSSPFIYADFPPEEVSFVPLDMDRTMNLEEILEEHPKGKEYANLLEDFDKYPVILDSQDKVLSFPPIINGELTRVTEKTKNLFIDVTGYDEKTINQTLNILVSNIAERTGEIETIKIHYSDRVEDTPNLDPVKVEITLNEINGLLGLDLDEKEAVEIFERMRYGVAKYKGGKLEVLVPAYRTDILHKVDLIEDIAIGYGYNNFDPVLPKLATIGKISDKEKFSDKVRDVMIGLGFQEVMTFILTNSENNFSKPKISGEAVEILNPTSNEYNICRTWLIPNLLKVLSTNKHIEYPQKVFEVGNSIIIDNAAETRTKDIRKLAGVISYDNANLTEIKSVVESVCANLGLDCTSKNHTHPSFIPTRVGAITVNGKTVGFFGEIHPEVLENFQLERPVIAFEIDLDYFV